MKVIQIWCGDTGEIYKKYERCMDSVRDLFTPNYERVFVNDLRGLHPIITSDTVRMEIASQTPDMFYMDCDVEFHSIPEFECENDLPFFGLSSLGRVNHSVFFVNGNTKYFERIVEDKKTRGIQDVFGWPLKIITDLEAPNIIDSNLFVHHEFTSTEVYKKYESGADHPWESVGLHGRENEWD